jgi:hypothetical protein
MGMFAKFVAIRMLELAIAPSARDASLVLLLQMKEMRAQS